MRPGFAASMMPSIRRAKLFRRCIHQSPDDMPWRGGLERTSPRLKPLAHARGTQGTLPSGSIGYFIQSIVQNIVGRPARAFG